ncbi:tumor necrosis factor receptor superfamily member 14-like [Scomber scombrus]|uniref:tumor necrosis factor receptor superfamily member 14-like n=1 Tax=Scomber scombrus TaxID=13677 RepID=UPI002DDA3A65|nr:tumor necrosis factor receptor superfamily member 14-like [Scomber scombrus]
MFSTLFVFEIVAVFTVRTLCCRVDEYITRDGQCCPMCHEGTVVRRDCTLQSGTRCVPCERGTFMNQANGLNKCFTCTSCDPAHGLSALQTCTAVNNTVCEVINGHFCKSLTDTGCSLAEKHTHCIPGQGIKEPGTSRNDTVCEDCQPGYFSPDGVNCTAWTICSETQVQVKEGSQTIDIVCGAPGALSASRHHYLLIPPFLLFFSLVCLMSKHKCLFCISA